MQRRADAPAGDLRCSAVLDGRENHRTLSQPGRRPGQAIQIAGGLDVFLAAKIANNALLGLAALAHGLDQVDIAIGADALLADEHGISIAEIRINSTINAIKYQ